MKIALIDHDETLSVERPDDVSLDDAVDMAETLLRSAFNVKSSKVLEFTEKTAEPSACPPKPMWYEIIEMPDPCDVRGWHSYYDYDTVQDLVTRANAAIRHAAGQS